VSIWEPFSEGARKAVVRAQELPQGSETRCLGVEHLAVALADGDDDIGRLLSDAFEYTALEADARVDAQQQMVFTRAAKRTIELAFANARRLNHSYIGSAHLALRLLEISEAPPLRAGVDLAELRMSLDAITDAGNVNPSGVIQPRENPSNVIQPSEWKYVAGNLGLHPATNPILAVLARYADLACPGVSITLTMSAPDGESRSGIWQHV